MKKAFSLIELIIVMVILGIIAGIGSDIIRTLYDNYAITAKIQNLEMQANNVADIIANRLEHRIEQTLAVQNGEEYKPLASASAADESGSLIFYRRAYELERNFATYKASQKGEASQTYAAPRYSGFISAINTTTTDSGTDETTTFVDEIVIENLESSGIDLATHEVFFNDDDGLFYKDKKNPFDRYYAKGERAYAYACGAGGFSYEESSGKITLKRSSCPKSTATDTTTSTTTSAENIIRPSMARLIHKIYLSNEINKIRLEDKNLYLDICDPVGDKTCATPTSENLLADNASVFRFTTITSNENIASGVVFKLCLAVGDGDDKAQACQTRIVR